MLDQFDRNIDYMRISVTDRCNLRCRYCMPEGADYESHEAILRYEEILRICRAAIGLGVRKFKITAAVLDMLAKGCEMVLCSGGMSVDPDDKTPRPV